MFATIRDSDAKDFSMSTPIPIAEPVGAVVRMLSDPEKSVPISFQRAVHPARYEDDLRGAFVLSQTGDDWILLNLWETSPEADSLQYVSFDEPKLYDPIALVSLNSNVIAIRTLRGEQDFPDSWRDFMFESTRTDGSPFCRVFTLSDGCISHSCQSDGGDSGAPLLSLSPNSQIRVIGIQRGATSGEKIGVCADRWSRYFPNTGVPIDDELRQVLDFVRQELPFEGDFGDRQLRAD